MVSLRQIVLCMNKNFKKWKTSPRVYLLILITVVFQYSGFEGYRKIAEYLDHPINMFLFPMFFVYPIMVYIFAAFPMLLYGEAPFTDRQSPFMVIRSGRLNWILGQICYILLSSLIIAVFTAALSIVMLLPRVEFNTEWGPVMWTLAQDYSILEEAGVHVLAPTLELMQQIGPMQAMLLTVSIYWLAGAFLGTVILCFNIIVHRGFGLIVAGCIASLSYFSYAIINQNLIGLLNHISPLNWICVFRISLTPGKLSPYPTVPYVFTFFIVGILTMSVISVIAFCKKDLDFEKGEY